ncbi:MAG: FG-GAP-like repeat-containing protein [Pontiellaceae bacterium]|nr:FG-GAP-like repeat-containing protein [Pontiellaceae bacterium]
MDYSAGFKVMHSKRLARIEAKSSGALVAAWVPQYGHDEAGRLRIESITRFGTDGITFLPPVVFTYSGMQKDEEVFQKRPNYELPVWLSDSWFDPDKPGDELGDHPPADAGTRFADLNGDGFQDILCSNGRSLLNVAYLNTGSGWVKDMRFALPVDPVSGPVFLSSGTDEPSEYTVMDLNGDGRADILGKTAYTNSGSGWAPAPQWNLPAGLALEAVVDPSCIISKSGSYPCNPLDWPKAHIGLNVQFPDLNGDSLPDIVYAVEGNFTPSVPTGVHIYLNTGNGWIDAGAAAWKLPNGYRLLADLANDSWTIPDDGGLQFADLNGDGLSDLIFASGHANGFEAAYDGVAISGGKENIKVWLNNGSGWEDYTEFWALPYTFTTPGFSPNPTSLQTDSLPFGMRLVDLNGDGMTDIYVSHRYDLPFLANQHNYLTGIIASLPGEECEKCGGTGWYEYVDDDGCNKYAKCDCTPPDFYFWGYSDPYGQAEEKHEVWLNTGAGWKKDDAFLPPDDMAVPIIGTAHVRIKDTSCENYFSPYMGYAFGSSGLVITDITGDGIPEFISACRADISGFQGNEVVSGRDGVELMACTQNGMGGSARATYTSARATEDFHSPQVPRVVDTYILSDGMGLSYTSRYNYAGGRYFHDPSGNRRHEFLGFHKRSTTDSEGITKVVYFHQGNGVDPENDPSGELADYATGELADPEAKRSQVYREETWGADGKLYSATVSKWNVASYITPYNQPRYWAKKADDVQFKFIPATGAHREVASRTVYDDTFNNIPFNDNTLGLPMAVKQYGEVKGNPANGLYDSETTGNDETYTFTEYKTFPYISTCPQLQYCVDKPSISRICSADNKDNLGCRLKETQSEYRADGLLDCTKVWWNTEDRFVTTLKVLEYDAYGNPTLSQDAAGLKTTIVYDDFYHQYPVSTTLKDPVTGVELTSLTDYDARSGQLFSSTDPAGMTASTEYDEFLRPVRGYKDDLLLQEKEYVLNGVNGAQGTSANYVHTKVYAGVTNGTTLIADSYVYADGLGREIQTRAESEKGNNIFRVNSTIYDEQGRIAEAFEPRFENGGAFVPFKNPFNPAVTYKYDALGRVTTMTPRQGDAGSPTAPILTAYGLDDNPWAVMITDALGIKHRIFKNAWEQTIRVEEDVEGQTLGTTYVYDRLQRLTDTLDPKNNCIQLFFDSLDLKTKMIDPDMGIWIYGYDQAGRMTSQLDAVGNRIEFDYDAHGRPEEKRVYAHNDLGTPQDTVTFEYDSSDDADFTVYPGQLYRTTQNGIVNCMSYDTHGNVLKTEQVLTGSDPRTWITSTTYDELDRPDTITYPGNQAAVKYNYGPVGNLESVSSVYGTGENNKTLYKVDSFNELSQVESVSYGNGVQSQFAYYPNSRRLRTSSSHAGKGRALQNLSYTFNAGGLMTAIKDNLYTGKRSSTYDNIQYDELNRLKAVTYAKESDLLPAKTKTYHYDILGNITKNDDYDDGKTYVYDTSRPHAVASIGSDNFTYDDNGNITDAMGRVLTFDAQNRLVTVLMSDIKVKAEFTYLDGGQRLSKKVTVNLGESDERVNTTYYVGPGYEEHHGTDGDETLCHVFFDTKRVATFNPIPNGQNLAAAPSSGTEELLAAAAAGGLMPGGKDPGSSRWTRRQISNGNLICYVAEALPDVRRFKTIVNTLGVLTVALFFFFASRERYGAAPRRKVRRIVGYGGGVASCELRVFRHGGSAEGMTSFGVASSELRVASSEFQVTSLKDLLFEIQFAFIRVHSRLKSLSLRSFVAEFRFSSFEFSAFGGSAGGRQVLAKKVLYTFFAVCMLVSPTYAQTGYQRGDVNGDGEVNIVDALFIQQVVDGKRDPENGWDAVPFFANGDVNYDGATNATDARIIMEFCVGKRTEWPDPPAGPQRMMYYHDDHLGSASVVTDRVGEVVSHITYTPYGEMRNELNLGASVNYLYTGQEFDREIGLYYYGARYYDQAIGRFISPDTIIPDPADTQAYNRYSYVYNNPIKYNDPTGHSGEDQPDPPPPPPPENQETTSEGTGQTEQVAQPASATKSEQTSPPPDASADTKQPVTDVAHTKDDITFGFKSSDLAAMAADALVGKDPSSKRREFGAVIYKSGDQYGFTLPYADGQVDGVDLSEAKSRMPEGSTLVGDYHNHTDYSIRDANTGEITYTGDPVCTDAGLDNFSGTDRDNSLLTADTEMKKGGKEYTAYVSTPSSAVLRMDMVVDGEWVANDTAIAMNYIDKGTIRGHDYGK